MDIDDLTLKQIKEIKSLLNHETEIKKNNHPMIGRMCLIRCYSAGVHIGMVESVNDNTSTEVHLKNALRLWKWEGGGLSLSAVANNGIEGGRLNRTGEIYLTGAIEFIPVTQGAWESYEKFIED